MLRWHPDELCDSGVSSFIDRPVARPTVFRFFSSNLESFPPIFSVLCCIVVRRDVGSLGALNARRARRATSSASSLDVLRPISYRVRPRAFARRPPRGIGFGLATLIFGVVDHDRPGEVHDEGRPRHRRRPARRLFQTRRLRLSARETLATVRPAMAAGPKGVGESFGKFGRDLVNDLAVRRGKLPGEASQTSSGAATPDESVGEEYPFSNPTPRTFPGPTAMTRSSPTLSRLPRSRSPPWIAASWCVGARRWRSSLSPRSPHICTSP